MNSQAEEGGRGQPQRENLLLAIVIYGQICVRRGWEGQMTPQKSVSLYLDGPLSGQYPSKYLTSPNINP